MGRVVIPGFRKIETSGGGEGGTTNYNDLTNKPSINNVPLVGNLNTVDLKLTDATLTEEGVPAEAKTVGAKLNKLEGKYAKKDLYGDTTINVGRKADTRIGSNSTAEGCDTTAGGDCSHAEGYDTTADGYCSHAEGEGTNASFGSQHVQGKYNIEDIESKYAHIVGNGNSDRERSNAHTVDWGGNAWYAGDVTNGNGVSLDGLNTNMSDVWNNSVTYGVNSYCIYNNKLWKCKVQHTNQPPTEGTYWTACTISGEISELNSNLDSVETLLNDKFVWTNQKIVLKSDKTYLIIARPFSSIVDNCFIGIVLGGYDIMPIYKSSIITVTRNGNEYSFTSTDVVSNKISLLAIKIDYQ